LTQTEYVINFPIIGENPSGQFANSCTNAMLKNKPKSRAMRANRQRQISAVDLFCGVGGLTRGLIDEGINVVAGIDIDEACKYPFETNNNAQFINQDVANLSSEDLTQMYPKNHIRILAGCAPCQPFSKYTQGNVKENSEWVLLHSFAELVKKLSPEIVSMENVPELRRHSIFTDFVETLKKSKYHVSYSVVSCADYGVPQRRNRLVLFASKFGEIAIIEPTHQKTKHLTVHEAIGHLPPLTAGEIDNDDPLHRSSRLSALNLRRIKVSKPAGSWQDWPQQLVAKCHKGKAGKTYRSVYGRIEWSRPSPTITTQFYGFGNGRFGHPKQHRALSLREGAILQSFPEDYLFVEPGGKYQIKRIGRLIGNAVPVRLGQAVGKTIIRHLESHGQ
jgi:DNA (cytosine-5)-methyltransferase 1